MEVNRDLEPMVVIAGMEEIIDRDLNKHKGLLEQSKTELQAFNEARSYQIQRRKHYKRLMQDKNSKYNKESMQTSMDMIGVDVRMYSDKVKLTQEAIAHHTEIVDTLTAQQKNQYAGLKELARQRKIEIDGLTNRLE